MFLVPHSRYALRTAGAFLALVSGRFEAESDGGANAHGVKHPNVKKCAFMPALPPKATGLYFILFIYLFILSQVVPQYVDVVSMSNCSSLCVSCLSSVACV